MSFKRIASLCIVLAVVASVLTPSVVAQQRDAEVALQEAMHAEQVEGNLDRAIRLYRDIADNYGDVRDVAATALLHLGQCYEKLGRTEATNAYRRLVREYGDQGEAAAAARERLAALSQLAQADRREVPAAQVRRLLMTAENGCYNVEGMRPSPDGTRLVYSCSGAIHVRDLASGEAERITTEGWYLGAVWAPDGTRLAVMDFNAERSPFKIIDLRSGAVESPAPLGKLWFSPRDWSSDGEWLSGTLETSSDISSSVVVSLRTGDIVELAQGINQGMANQLTFSPDGRYVAYTDLVDGMPQIHTLALATGERYRVVGEGGSPLWSPDGETMIYQGRGGWWAIPVSNGQPQGQPRLLNLKGGWQATWRASGFYHSARTTVVRAYRIGVDPVTAQPIGSPEVFQEVDGHDWFAWSPDMQQVAASDWAGAWDRIYVAKGRSVTVFPVGDEIMTTNLWWSGDGREILFTSKALAMRDKRKTVFALNPADGAVRELFPRLDSIHHLHVSPDGQRMVFLREAPGKIAADLVVSDLGDPRGRVLASSSHPEGDLSTMFGQPLFSPDGSQIVFLQQDWSDPEVLAASLWVVPSDGSEAPRLVARAPLIQRPIWHPDGRFIAFWNMDPRNEKSSVSVVSLETGEMRDVFTPHSVQNSLRVNDWSPDGHWIGISELTGEFEYWVTEHPLSEK